MKLRSIIILAVLPLAFLFQGCRSVRDISSQSPYSEWMGKKFVLQQDCYVFQFKENPQKIYIGRDLLSLPREVSPQFIQKKLKDVNILGILQKGSKFTIIGCDEVRTPENVRREFKATFDNQPPIFQGVLFNVFFLTDNTKTPPVFEENLAKPVE